MITKELPDLRASLEERLPDFIKPGLAQLEAMARAEERAEAERLRAQLAEANARIDEVERMSLEFYAGRERLQEENDRLYQAIYRIDPSWTSERVEAK